MDDFDLAVDTLKKSVSDGFISWVQACRELQHQTGTSLTYLVRIGAVATFKKADKNFVSPQPLF